MKDLVVIVPTRGRPMNYVRLCQAWEETRAQADLVISWDDDDPCYDAYAGVHQPIHWTDPGQVVTWPLPHTNMNTSLNDLAATLAPHYKNIGFMGDDHCPRTLMWDVHLVRALGDGPAIAYGNDLMQGALLPTAVFMSSSIVETLGYMAPPSFTHLFLDNVWRDWGNGLGRLFYQPQVVIEHLHPQAAGEKAEWDEGYVRVNGGEMWEKDEIAYKAYCEEQLAADIEKLRAI